MSKERYNIEKLHTDIKQLTPKEKRKHFESIIRTYDHWKNYEGKNYTGQLYEYGVYEEAKRLLEEANADKSIMYSHDLNYYYNPENVPNQDAVFATWDFLEHTRNGLFEPLQFFNLLFKQIHLLKDNIDSPIDFLQSLKSLPYSEEQLHLLLGMILYWHGGNTDRQLNPKYKTILKLIEKEFLSMYPDTLTHEKRFCLAITEQQKQITEAELVINQQLPKTYNIAGSKYLKRIEIDFEGLPTYIIEKGIIAFFEDRKMLSAEEYTQWQKSLLSFIPTIPEQYILRMLEKGIEYAQKAYAVHLEFECSNKDECALNESWERRISMAEYILRKINEGISPEGKADETEEEEQVEKSKNPDFTTARQVLAMHYLLEYCQVSGIDNTEKARFIQFLTGKETGTKKIQNTTIYKKVKNPFSLHEKTLMADLHYIRTYFEKLGMSEIVAAISKEIGTKT